MGGGQHPHRRLIELGSDHHGMVARRRLVAEGFGRRQIAHYVERGTLWPFFRGTYSVGGPAGSWLSALSAAMLAAGPDAVIAGLAAASLLKLTKREPALIEVHRPKGRRLTTRSDPASGRLLELRVFTRKVPESAAVVCEGLRTLSVPEVLLDLAGRVPEWHLESLVSEASRLGEIDESSIGSLDRVGRGRAGIGELRRQLRYWDPEMKNVLSVLEAKFLNLCRERGIETPRTNHRVCGLMVDFAWLERRVVVEVDGYAFHGDRVSFERDHQRQATLLQGGFLRLSFTYRQVTEHPEQVVAAVLKALATWNP